MTIRTVAWALLFCGCLSGCRASRACGLVFCTDGATIAIHRSDWATPSFAVQLDIAGRKVECPAPAPERLDECDSFVGVAITLVPRAQGYYEELITISGTPARVVVTLRSNDAPVAQRTFDLVYESSEPNGPGCNDPPCRHATTPKWEVRVEAPDGGPPDTAPADVAAADVLPDRPAQDGRSEGDAAAEAPTDLGKTDAPPSISCGGAPCAAGEVCVRRQVFGGACLPVGDGGCPSGSSPAGPCCVADPSYRCAARPPGCDSGLTCACAGVALCTAGFTCATPRSDEIRCTLFAP
jgi:hypothetical protein